MNGTQRCTGLLAFLLFATTSATAGTEEEQRVLAQSKRLDDSTIAMVGGQTIPYDWFLHEFRSTFFRYASAPDVRQTVFDAFIDRIIIHEAAVREGVHQDPELRARVRERIEHLRSFMEYQLAMTERAMITDHFLSKLGLGLDDFEVTEDELRAFIKRDLQERTGAPDNIRTEDVPPQIRDQLRNRIRHEKQQAALKERRAVWTDEAPVEINQPLIDNVPLPNMPDDMPRPGARIP